MKIKLDLTRRLKVPYLLLSQLNDSISGWRESRGDWGFISPLHLFTSQHNWLGVCSMLIKANSDKGLQSSALSRLMLRMYLRACGWGGDGSQCSDQQEQGLESVLSRVHARAQELYQSIQLVGCCIISHSFLQFLLCLDYMKVFQFSCKDQNVRVQTPRTMSKSSILSIVFLFI